MEVSPAENERRGRLLREDARTDQKHKSAVHMARGSTSNEHIYARRAHGPDLMAA
ncbi:MAG: hypothetical protein JOZ58_19785 [Acetobacteraceae bacterium]|nr:hypothetical protein [Acetobacteraceae bacterium]